MAKVTADNLREIAFEYFKRKGTPLERISGTGNRWVVRLPDDTLAVLKCSARGAMMVSAVGGKENGGGAYTAELIGMESDVDNVLAVMRDEITDVISLYVIPRDVVVERLKENHKKWLLSHPGHVNPMRVVYFRNHGLPKEPYAHLHDEWAKYLFDEIKPNDDMAELSGHEDAVRRAKMMVANTFGVNSDQVEISVRL